MLRLLYLIPLAVFAVLAVYLAIGLTKDPRKLPSALVDKPAPAFTLPPLQDGQPGLSSDDLKGHTSILNVFASWCVPCKVEHPLWMEIVKQKIAPLYGIAWKDKRADAIAWLAELGNPYARIGHDPDNKVGIDWGVYGVPETYIIDRTGRIRYKHVGPMHAALWKSELLPLLQKLKAEEGGS
jgi:cytochrome c biogenesis protein CcmG/thiol:disulfide interchange protein DsbE